MSRPYLLLNELKANYIQNQPMNIEYRPTFDRRNIRADTHHNHINNNAQCSSNQTTFK